MARSIVHSAHSTHAAARHRWALLLRQLGNHRLGGDEQTCNGRGTLQCCAHHLGRIDDAFRYQVDVLARLRVETKAVGILFEDLADDDRAILACIERDLARRPRQRFADNVHAVLLVFVRGANALEHLGRAQQRNATAWQDAFLDGGAGRVHGVINAILALLHFDLRRAPDADHRDAACEFGQPLLELLAIVIRDGFLDLCLDLSNTRLDIALLASAVDDRGVLLIDHQLLGLAKHGERDILELNAEIFANRLAAGQDGDILQHCLAAIAEAGRLDGRDLEAAAQLVDHEGRQRLALHVLGNDEQRFAGLYHRLKKRQQFLKSRQFLFINQDIRVFHLDPHLFGIGDEVRRDVAAVELHALDHFELGLERLGFLDRDHALVADLLHGVGKKAPDLRIAVGRNGADLCNLLVRGDIL